MSCNVFCCVVKGRNPTDYSKMMDYINAFTGWSPTVSVELEKTRPELLALALLADVVSLHIYAQLTIVYACDLILYRIFFTLVK